MTTYSKLTLSELPVTNRPKYFGGETDMYVHTTSSVTSTLDEVWIWAVNNAASARIVQVAAYDNTDVGSIATVSVAARSTELLVPGIPFKSFEPTWQTTIRITDYDFTGSNPGDLYVFGYVNRISQ